MCIVDERFYRALEREDLESREDDEAAQRELVRRDVRNQLRELNDRNYLENNPFEAVEAYREVKNKAIEYDLDLEEDFDDTLYADGQEIFSTLLNNSEYKAAEQCAEVADIDEEFIEKRIDAEAEQKGLFQSGRPQSAFAIADLFGIENKMKELASDVYESIPVESRPIFTNYLQEKGIQPPNPLESDVEEAKNRYKNRAEEIEQEIAELKSELEETRDNRDSYDRFLEQ